MKFLLVFLLGVSLYANAANEAARKLTYMNSYTVALKTAKEEQKMLMLLVVEDGCHWCQKFEIRTLSDKDIISKITPFVKVVVDRYADIPEQFKSRFFPMVYFINPKTEDVIAKSYGYRTKALFLEDIRKVEIFSRRKEK